MAPEGGMEAEQNGITKVTLRRAKKDLCVKSRKTPGRFDGALPKRVPSTKNPSPANGFNSISGTSIARFVALAGDGLSYA